MIWKLTTRNLQANARRFAMTTFGVVIAVAFVVSAFVLGDGLRNTFGALSTEIVGGTDLEVRAVEEFGAPQTLSDTELEAVRSVDGVAMAVGSVEAAENSVRPITPDGGHIPQGPPQLAFNWIDAPGFSPFTLVDGQAPDEGEFVIDIGSAERYGFDVGETYTLVTPTGRHELSLSGLTRFGSDNQTLGAVLMSMNDGQVADLFGTSGYDAIGVALTDTARSDLAATQAAIAAAVPHLTVIDQATVLDETTAEFNSQISIIQNVLLGFAGVALLVSVFIIANTFAIVLQQRTAEMGLLRLVGADAAQLRRGAMGEAAGVGLLASAVGIPAGIGVATGLTALMGAIGLDLPSYDIIVSWRTIAVALFVGLGVTLVAAWRPTRAATNVPALAALGGGTTDRVTSSRRRTVAAGALGATGIALAAAGAGVAESTDTIIVLTVAAALALFAATTLIAPRLVGPVTTAFGLLFGRFGMSGRLAVRNSKRHATRTATTASALMIGLAVVSMALVVGESIKTEMGNAIENELTADYLLTDQANGAGFPGSVVAEIDADPVFGPVTGFRETPMQIAGPTGDPEDRKVVTLTGARFDDLPELINLEFTAGSYGSATGDVIIRSTAADAGGLTLGDSVSALLANGTEVELTIAGVFGDSTAIAEDWVTDIALFDQHGVTVVETWIAFSPETGASPDAVAAAVASLAERYPQGSIETAGEFRESVEALVDQILSVMNVLVALAILIALIGIANTLALSISERTREIGLARAVGMTERGVRRMVRYEAAMISAFGAVLGVVVGLALGWLTVEAMPASVTDTLAIPFGQITMLVAVAAVAGLFAAMLPARRGGRMNVLAAIDH